jgi:hypothetical protein
LSESAKISRIALFALFGAGTDFLANGVLKLGLMVVYVPLYIAMASAFPKWFPGPQFKELMRPLTGAFFAGALISHLALAGRTGTVDYPMNVTSTASPLTLVSRDGMQTLLLSGEKIRQTLAAQTGAVPVRFQFVTDYGCTRSYKILSVAGTDVDSDAAISWVWKTRPGALSPKEMRPSLEGPPFFWCRVGLKFER